MIRIDLAGRLGADRRKDDDPDLAVDLAAGRWSGERQEHAVQAHPVQAPHARYREGRWYV